MKYYTYILSCADNSYYVGHTSCLEKRLIAHNLGEAALYTKNHGTVTLAYYEEFLMEKDSISREIQLKKWTHAKKKALIDGDILKLKQLSKSK